MQAVRVAPRPTLRTVPTGGRTSQDWRTIDARNPVGTNRRIEVTYGLKGPKAKPNQRCISRNSTSTEPQMATQHLEPDSMNAASDTITPLSYLDGRITVNPDLCNGHPTIRGLRITVETILDFLGAGETREEILNQYPSLEPADIDACLRFAADLMRHRYTLKSVA
jgi:uncharacterized protein (DUF433 family)